MYLRLCFEFFKSPVFLRKFCICPMFFMIEWFLMVSITLLNCTFTGSVVYFFMIVSKVWCNICFVCYVRNLTLFGKEAIRFTDTITFYCLCFLFRDYFFVINIDNWFNICHAAITYFHVIFVEYFMIFVVVWKIFFELKERNIYRCCWRRSLKKVDWTRRFFFRQFTFIFIFIIWWFVLKFVVVPKLI